MKYVIFIKEITYPTKFPNIVMVKRTLGKSRICVDFTKFYQACSEEAGK